MHCIDACPSGALSYEIPDQPESLITTIRVLKDGPYRVSGKPRLIDVSGKSVETERAFCLCRCEYAQASRCF
jgi:ferredoxin